MDYTVLVVALAAIAYFYLKDFNNKQKRRKPPAQQTAEITGEEIKYKYQKKKNFLTKSEYAFFHALQLATKDTHHIIIKTRLADLIEADYPQNSREYMLAFNQISRKHIDYVLLNKSSLRVEHAIELDGKSHNRKSQQKNDQFKNSVLILCGIKLTRFKVGEEFNSELISKKLRLGQRSKSNAAKEIEASNNTLAKGE